MRKNDCCYRRYCRPFLSKRGLRIGLQNVRADLHTCPPSLVFFIQKEGYLAPNPLFQVSTSSLSLMRWRCADSWRWDSLMFFRHSQVTFSTCWTGPWSITKNHQLSTTAAYLHLIQEVHLKVPEATSNDVHNNWKQERGKVQQTDRPWETFYPLSSLHRDVEKSSLTAHCLR